ncbi:hypothetical protein SAMN02927921_02817 [Sinomicrobium oceani]|uniref:Uncharacterized protein n=1 Tax=Sinomicrobium oceani TaxID=1150368 RepID=A0A1K1QSE3_9FLAO|nr:hypothetical protein [Sinomicrobium oceani]SFW62792.1 hypothetical protein SAMN02927921_02817 [Sinomicrobium oceani]
MADYSLDIQFTQDQLQILYMAGSNVVVAKPSGDGSTPNVAWQVFKPMQANTLSWDEEYGIYASTSEVTNGAKLVQLSSVDVGAPMNKLFTLQPSAVISGPADGGTKDAFSLLNKYDQKSLMTVGLYQNANVNGTDIIGNAISAVPTLLSSTAVMTPYTTVYIWLQSQVKSNSVVTTVTSPMTELKFGGGTNRISVKYDSQSGKFINSGQAKSSKVSIHYLEPAL